MEGQADIFPPFSCTGCSACIHSCPKGAIKMHENSEGFLYPQIDKNICINCGKCKKVCPMCNNIEKHKVHDGIHYIAQIRNKRLGKKSASGGAFVGIAKYIIEELDGVVFGAALQKDNVVRHIYVEDSGGLKLLQNSKYVQSDIGNCYMDVKKYLLESRYVFFTGTPCQVAGLYRFLGEPYDKLITADIICHGVPSPRLLREYIDNNSRGRQGKVKSLKFRYKHPFFKTGSFFYMLMLMEKGPRVIKQAKNDLYFSIFLKGYAFRESCYKCRFAEVNRIGDFTIGDCDSHKEYPHFHPKESNSTLMLNSAKAEQLWNEGIETKFDFCPLDIEKEAAYNKQLRSPFPRPNERNTLYQEWKIGYMQLERKYTNQYGIRQRITTLIACLLPPPILNMLLKLRYFIYH